MYLAVIISLLIVSVLIVFYLFRQKSELETFNKKFDVEKMQACHLRMIDWKNFWNAYKKRLKLPPWNVKYQRYRFCENCGYRGDCKK